MALYNLDVETIKARAYQNEPNFNNFLGITLDKWKKIKRISSFIEGNPSYNKYLESIFSMLNLSKRIDLNIQDFDSRLIYLIYCADPNLIHLREYKKCSAIVNTLDDADEINKVSTSYPSSIRKNVGFYDSKMLKYEYELFNRVLDNGIFLRFAFIKDFNISEERLGQIKELVSEYKTKYPNWTFLDYAFATKFGTDLLGLNGIEEKAAFFILTTDPELRHLQIFEEESKKANIVLRSTNELGYFNKDMVKVEKLFGLKYQKEEVENFGFR